MTTQFGKELKKLRIDLGITLLDMATAINVSAAFLSAIETGRKRIPDGILDALAKKFPQIKEQREKFEALVAQARKEVSFALENASYEDAMLATALARKFGSLTDEEKNQLRNYFVRSE
jgi:transcriptional regulator with XRE-family HTH domain